MRVVSIVGNRPQFIKLYAMCQVLAGHQHTIVHTGQHYDRELSSIFFGELNLPRPDINLDIGLSTSTHAQHLAAMVRGVERFLERSPSDWVLVYGDTDTTLAASLASRMLNRRLGHVEAGLRSFNRSMPEELNRRVSDMCSDLLFCPMETAAVNLDREAVDGQKFVVGDTTLDTLSAVRTRLKDIKPVTPAPYGLLTIHRPPNTRKEILLTVLEQVVALDCHVVFPAHPRLKPIDTVLSDHVLWISPLSYLNMLATIQMADFIVTDSSGVARDAYYLGRPSVLVRTEFEWPELVDAGWVVLADSGEVATAAKRTMRIRERPRVNLGDGKAAEKIVALLEANL